MGIKGGNSGSLGGQEEVEQGGFYGRHCAPWFLGASLTFCLKKKVNGEF